MSFANDVRSASEAPPWTTEDLETAEAARCAAMIAGDGNALRALIAEDATWIHSSGQVDSRDRFIGKIEGGASCYLEIDRSETTTRLVGDVAIASGIATMDALADGAPRSMRNRYVNVWAMRHGHPVLVSAQSTKLA